MRAPADGMHGTHGVYPVGIHVGVAIREVNDIFIQLTECGDHPLVSNDMFIIGIDLGYLSALSPEYCNGIVLLFGLNRMLF